MDWFATHSGALAGLSSIVLTIITAWYVVLTWKLLRETQVARAEAKRPELAVYLRPSEAGISFILLTIENIGSGPAYNVRFTTNVDFRGDHTRLREVGLFKMGLGYFAPRQRIDHFLTGVVGILEDLKKQPLEIVATYQSAADETFDQSFVLDFGEFENLSSIGEPPLQKIASAVDQLQKDVHQLGAGARKPIVLTETLDEHQRRQRSEFLSMKIRDLSDDDRKEIEDLVEKKAKEKGTWGSKEAGA